MRPRPQLSEAQRRSSGRAGRVRPSAAVSLFLLALLGAATPTNANSYCVSDSDYLPLGDKSDTFPQCHTLMVCRQPVLGAVTWELVDSDCDPQAGPCGLRARVATRFPGNHQNSTAATGGSYSFATLRLTDGSGSEVDVCGFAGATIEQDLGEFVHAETLTCAQAGANPAAYRFTLAATMCPCGGVPGCTWGSCEKKVTIELDFAAEMRSYCVPKAECACETESASGPCSMCAGVEGASCGVPRAPRASFTIRPGGAGNSGLPGATAWSAALGRNLGHSYAQRIVQDPGRPSRVWLITSTAVFREFRDGNGDGFYEYASPSSEKRRLRRTAGGWTLEELDGGVHVFDSEGRWLSSRDANGIGRTASYAAGMLVRVDMADGQHELFRYHPDGKLAEIEKVGVDGASSRTWRYLWEGDDLARIELPDGLAYRMAYEDPRHPGFLTRMILVGTDGSERLESALGYDAAGRATDVWRGSAAPGANGPVPTANAVDHWHYRFTAFDAGGRVSRIEVTDPLGNVSVREQSHDPRSETPRLVSTSGDCPTCGLGPNSQLTYDDPAHPMRATEAIDGRGTITRMSYDANGLVRARTEALGTAIERTTIYEHAGPFPSLVTRITQPSTSGAGSRVTRMTYDDQGNLRARTIEGFEAGEAFSYSTLTTPSPEGPPLEIDPPGHDGDDKTAYTYDALRGNLLPLTRTDPLIGTTRFGYDAFNRRTSVVDPNGVETVTTYDDGDRVREVRQLGASALEDLVTTYEYTPFGDLERTILPRGNVIENVYDDAGRLIEVHRKPDRFSWGERTVSTLDALGHRIHEEQQRWDGAQWITDAYTGYRYLSRCHLDQVLHADGSVTEYGYDCDGNLERIWDANHPSNGGTEPPTTRYVYDELDRLKENRQPWEDGGEVVTKYFYDVQDHLIRVQDAELNVTDYIYSDRDLMTEQISEVSGLTNYRYDASGELVEENDARGFTSRRTIDALDRVALVDYEDDAIDTAYTYDDPMIPYSKGRLTAIIRDGHTVPYEYDRFGRITTDGGLRYAYDPNGNRREIVYPGDVKATYAFDFADRPTELILEVPVESPQTIATGARYLASGPLTALTLGNGVQETRGYDASYHPTSILAEANGASLLDWRYTTDPVGNILTIEDGTGTTRTREFDYQDYQYFLTQGNGPWGDLAWTYDKIGNRLSETRERETSVYGYYANRAGGRNPKLNTVAFTATPLAYFYFDAAGNQTHESRGDLKFRMGYDAGGRLSSILRDEAGHLSAVSTIRYDGRGYAQQAIRTAPASGTEPQVTTWTTYASEGVLMGRMTTARAGIAYERETATVMKDAQVLYMALRPVAIYETMAAIQPSPTEDMSQRLIYLITDHLGTPVVALEGDALKLWGDGFEPFGGNLAEATGVGQFLRLPGQWSDDAWEGSGLLQNGHRWYAPGTGRYSRVDPLYGQGEPFAYLYALGNPLFFSDPSGLDNVGCTIDQFVGRNIKRAVETSCTLECCALHDLCYDLFDCSSNSWLVPWGECHSVTCELCNVAIEFCLLKCVVSFGGDNPRIPNYYCPRLHRFVNIPGDIFRDVKTAEQFCEFDHGEQACCRPRPESADPSGNIRVTARGGKK